LIVKKAIEVIVNKVRSDNFELIYPLLERFNNARVNKEKWSRLFLHEFSPGEQKGLFLKDKGTAVGYIGMIYSKRIVENKEYKLCNLTSWIVDDEYKNYSMQLLFEILKMKDVTITNLTPSVEASEIFTKFGYEELESSYLAIFPKLKLPCNQNINIHSENCEIKNLLSIEEQTIIEDHKITELISFVIELNESTILIIGNFTSRKKMKFFQIHYVSNYHVFEEVLDASINKICLHLKCFGLLIDSRFIQNKTKSNIKIFNYSVPRLFKSNQLSKSQIDSLYSELVLLHNY
jgi:hypothetical protein